MLCLLLSCTNDNYQPAIIKDSSVIIGNRSDNYTIFKPNPEKIILLPGKDSLDLDLDGVCDIVFKKAYIPTITGIGFETVIYTRNNLQVQLTRIDNNPDTLNLKTVLNFRSPMSGSTPNTYVLYRYACYSYLHCLRYGNFGNVTAKYIGFKMEKKFGWVLIDNSPGKLIIKEYTTWQKISRPR